MSCSKALTHLGQLLLQEAGRSPQQVLGAIEPHVVLPGGLGSPQVGLVQPGGEHVLRETVHRRAQVHVTFGAVAAVGVAIGRMIARVRCKHIYITPGTFLKTAEEKLRLAEVSVMSSLGQHPRLDFFVCSF